MCTSEMPKESKIVSIKDLAGRVIHRLKSGGLNPYVYYKAKTGSIYIKFEEQEMRSLRIGDHDGRERYRYKWNLRSDIDRSYEEVDRNVHRFYFMWDDWKMMVDRMIQYRETMLKNGKNKKEK